MALFLTVHTHYTGIQLGLFENTELIQQVAVESKQASKYLLTLIQELIKQCPHRSIDFIAAQQGPAPFTTLRVALATINGIAFATQLPLIAVNSLHVFLDQYQHLAPEYTPVALLNAFSHDIYYAYYAPNNQFTSGVSNINHFIDQLATLSYNFYIIGNAVPLYKQIIQEKLLDRAHIPQTLPDMASLQAVAHNALDQWHAHKSVPEILPLYLKGARPF